MQSSSDLITVMVMTLLNSRFYSFNDLVVIANIRLGYGIEGQFAYCLTHYPDLLFLSRQPFWSYGPKYAPVAARQSQ